MVSVTFQTTPQGAEVFLDSADTLKITSVTLDIAEGPHTYMLRLAGYEDIIRDFTVAAGYSYLLEATMTETTTAEQLKLNEKLVQLGWAGLAIATAGILVALMQVRKKASSTG